MKDSPMTFKINPNTTKASLNIKKNENLKSQYIFSRYNSISNIPKGTLNSVNFFTRNQENPKANEIKHFNSDTNTLYNKTNNFRYTNLMNKNTLNLNPSGKRNDFISTKNSNLISTNYKTQALAYKTKDSHFNHSMNSLAENKKSILTFNKLKLSDSNVNKRESLPLKKTKAKNKSVSNDINQLIRSIYDYTDESTENSHYMHRNRNLEEIIEESSPRNNKFIEGKNAKKFFNGKMRDNKSSEKKQQEIKLSLMEKYLISTDYSMNLTYKMRQDFSIFLNK